MSDTNFPSDHWVGFYVYAYRSRRFLMELVLEFRHGTISGEGADGIGLFVIGGRYDPAQGECFWIKTYVGRHSVEYPGYWEQKGIWGTWTLGHTKGGFHIWPLGDGTPLEELKNEVEEEFPLQTSPNRPLQPAAR